MNMHAAAINGHSIITTFERDGFHAVCIWCGTRIIPSFDWDILAAGIHAHLVATHEDSTTEDAS